MCQHQRVPAPETLLWFAAGLAVMTALTVGLHRWFGTGLGWSPLQALLRAVLQLAVIAMLLRGILSAGWWAVLAFVVLMLATASWTAVRRLDQLWHGHRAAVLGVLAGALVSLGAIVGLGLVEREVRYLVAVAGIVVGNAMGAATTTGRRFQQTATDRAAEVEAWFALGARPWQAHREVARLAVRETMLPSLDQTRSTGLVTLPGAFVGALFGGASPVTAAMFQLVVLAGIALATTVTAVVVTRVAGRSPYVSGGQAAG